MAGGKSSRVSAYSRKRCSSMGAPPLLIELWGNMQNSLFEARLEESGLASPTGIRLIIHIEEHAPKIGRDGDGSVLPTCFPERSRKLAASQIRSEERRVAKERRY